MQTCRKELCCHARRALSFRVVVGGGWGGGGGGGGGGLGGEGCTPRNSLLFNKKAPLLM